MNDLDYLYSKLSNLCFISHSVNERYLETSRFVESITIDALDPTVSSLTGNIRPNPGVELCIKIKTHSKPQVNVSGEYPFHGETIVLDDDIVYPAAVKIGINLDTNFTPTSGPELYDESYINRFEWFNMSKCDIDTYGIFLNETIGKKLKYGARNTVNFMFRVFDNNGDETFISPQVFTIYPYKINLSGTYYPSSLDSAYEDLNQYLRSSNGYILEKGCRLLKCEVLGTTVSITDETPLPGFEEMVYKLTGIEWTHQRSKDIHISQYENVVINVSVGQDRIDAFDGVIVKGNLTDPKGVSHEFYFRPTLEAGVYTFNINTILDSDFKIGEDNDVATLILTVIGTNNGEKVSMIEFSSSPIILHYFSTSEENYDEEDLAQLFNKLSLY